MKCISNKLIFQTKEACTSLSCSLDLITGHLTPVTAPFLSLPWLPEHSLVLPFTGNITAWELNYRLRTSVMTPRTAHRPSTNCSAPD